MSINRLQYECLDGSQTVIEFYKDDFRALDYYTLRVEADGGTIEAKRCLRDFMYPGVVEFCGTERPLEIKWGAADRYEVKVASSAKLNLMVLNLEQRHILEDIFNGGWVCDVFKDGKLFWMGKITQTLGIEQYKNYPYALSLNINDGLGMTKTNQLLVIDYPEPTTVSTLEFIIKLINNYLYPNGDFSLFIANNLYPDGTPDDGRELESALLDPRVFMYNDKDEYISNSDVLSSLLGILNLRIFQWQASWYLVSMDAQWDAGSITLTEYLIGYNGYEYIGREKQDLGILDLYSCTYSDDYQLAGSTNINFIPSLRQVQLNQNFQMNTNIFPIAANRSTNNYRGFDNIDLELLPDMYVNQMRLWTNIDFGGGAWLPSENAGYLQVPVYGPHYERDAHAYTERVVNDELVFDRFFFALKSIPTLDGEILSTIEDTVGIKRTVEIKYTNSEGTPFWFWMNNPDDVNDPDAFPGWSGDFNLFRWDNDDDISIEAKMPFGGIYTGGTFKFSYYNCYDENYNWPEYYMLFSGFQFGIITGSYKLIPEKEKERRVKRRWLPIVGELLLSPIPIGVFGYVFRAQDYAETKRDAKQLQQMGENVPTSYTTSDIEWENTIEYDINPLGDSTLSFDYRIGISYELSKSYHEIHISSFYDRSLDSLERWRDRSYEYLEESAELIVLRSRNFYRDNYSYTTQLTGSWRSPSISPLQIVNDFEGRLYYPSSLQLNDKAAIWANTYVEFKAMQNITGELVPCDFSTLDFNDDFCTWTTSEMRQYTTRVTDDGGVVEAKGCLQLAINNLL